MNDWPIKHFLTALLILHLILLGVFVLDFFGIHIPLLQILIGFLYLTFVPGILIIRILRLHKLGNSKTLLFAVGLSIAFDTVLGVIINFGLHFIEFAEPLSFLNISAVFISITLLLGIWSYFKDKDYQDPEYVSWGTFFSPPVLILLLLPLLTIAGTGLVNYSGDNYILLVVLGIIGLIGLLVGLNRFITSEYYALAIFSVAVSLLLHRSLISPFLFGTDIQYEYHFFSLVNTNSFWDPGLALHSYNSVTSITVFPVIYTEILGISGISFFKVITPLFLALAPVGLYHIVRGQTNPRLAFWAVFVLIGFFGFYGEILQSAKSQISFLYFSLLLIALVDKSVKRKIFLVITFGLLTIVSYYTMAILLVIFIVFGWIALKIIGLLAKRPETFRGLAFDEADNQPALLKGWWVLILCVFVGIWYFVISDSSAAMIMDVINDLISSVQNATFSLDMTDPRVAQTIGILPLGTQSWQHEAAGWLNRICFIFIAAGILKHLFRPADTKFKSEYLAMAYTSILLLLITAVLPRFHLGISRAYFISLFFLSPFCIIGARMIFDTIYKGLNAACIKLNLLKEKLNFTYISVALFLVAYFLFNVSFVFEISGDVSYSVSISWKSILESDNDEVKSSLYSVIRTSPDMAGITWLANHRAEDVRLLIDRTAHLPIVGHGQIPDRLIGWLDDPVIRSDATYIYLNSLNTEYGIVTGKKDIPGGLSWGGWILSEDIEGISTFTEESSKVYSNGNSQIYYYISE